MFSKSQNRAMTFTDQGSYVDRPGAVWLNLTYASRNSAVIRVDTSNTDATTGRRSVRVESKAQYSYGLFIFDVMHSPSGCNTWPALWLKGDHWPEQGEIDIIESANKGMHGNQITLHTSAGCSMHNVERKQIGTELGQDCYNGTENNQGCGVRGNIDTYGPAFNDMGGGIYAMELRSEGIRVWQFPRKSIPRDLSVLSLNPVEAHPDPNGWGKPLADFPSNNCNVGEHFRNMRIVANIDICGQWAGIDKFYVTESSCPGTCVDYVSKQPGSVYSEAYWEFGGWHVFEGHKDAVPEAAKGCEG